MAGVHPWQAAAVITDKRHHRREEGSSAMAGRRSAITVRTVPVPLALTLRRHIDLARVSSASCR